MLKFPINPTILLLLIIVVCQTQAKRIKVTELTNSWTLKDSVSGDTFEVAKIPSGVYTALAQEYGDLLGAGNDINLRWIANRTWIYNTTFDLGDELAQDSMVNLTFHGIDTVAKIWLNGDLLGETDNMFVRYSFVVGHLLKVMPSHNVLEVELLSPLTVSADRAQQLHEKGSTLQPGSCPASRGNVECHRNMLRKMQMSFGGEWNPAALSMGIWKPVTLEYYTVAILRDVDVAINHNDTHWTMDCRAFISTSDAESFYADMVVHASQLLDEPYELPQQHMNYASMNMEFQIHIPRDRVRLWWPNGYGEQKLYPVTFILRTYRNVEGPHLSSRTESQKQLYIGFRTIELVEDKDERGRSFYFRVNNHPIFMKGANYVPASTLPELSADSDAVENLLRAAQLSHMNMIRVWGGGLYESDTFYSLADRYGLLVWQDMAFTKSTYPIENGLLASMRLEASQNAQRLGHHASLALIVTNNEIELLLVKNRSDFGADAKRLEAEYTLLFMGNLAPELNIICRNDFIARPGPMISTPSIGIAEASKELATDPQSPDFGDVHFYEEDTLTPSYRSEARFVSEFGYASLPMRSSWLQVIGANASEEALAALIRQRQHDTKGFIPMLRLIAYQLPFSLQNWEDNIDEFIYFSQVAQAMFTKMDVELFRSRRQNYSTMGALVWQLNDVWVAPTWSFIDFYGNNKIVYYWAQSFLASPSIIAIYNDGNDQLNITVTREDYAEDRDIQLFTIFINTYVWNDIFPKSAIARTIGLGSNFLNQLHFPMDSVMYDQRKKSEIFLEILLKDNDEHTVAQNYFYPVPIKDIVGIRDPNLKLEVLNTDCSSGMPYSNSFSLRITVTYPALFIYLELVHENYTSYRHWFSTNGFTQTVPRQNVFLHFELDSECLRIRAEHIRVRTMNQYML